MRENLLREAARWVGHDTLLVVDPTDLTKPYARKMEYLAKVRDGSAKRIENRSIFKEGSEGKEGPSRQSGSGFPAPGAVGRADATAVEGVAMTEPARVVEECACGGLGWVVEPDGGVGRARRCACSLLTLEEWSEADRERALLAARVPRKYVLDFIRRRFEAPAAWPRDPRAPKIDPRSWRGRSEEEPWAVSLFGDVGAGKTRLALELLFQGLRELRSGRYIRAREIARLALDDGREGHEELRRLEVVELLLVDDLGVNHPGGAWGPVAEVLIRRSDEKRATLVTSHLTLRHVNDAGQPGLASRLTEGLILRVEGDDRRGLWLGAAENGLSAGRR